MPNPQPKTTSFTKRYPQASSALYQLLLGVLSFECMLSIARYDHNPHGSPPLFLSPAEMNATHEHICKMSAREADIPVAPLRYVVPYFMLCPSTSTLIGSCMAFIACLIKWNSFYPDSRAENISIALAFTFWHAKWTRILESVQMLLPLIFWCLYAVRALFHIFFKWAMPETYAKVAEYNKKTREQAEERRNKRKIEDMEMGELTQLIE